MAKKDPAILMQAYQKVGLDEAFSKAIVDGGNAKHIVETWKADWRGDNDSRHPAILAVLEGHATPEQARSLLEAADLHRDLVEAVAAGTKTVEWAHVVLNAGFKGQKEAVSALLDGADSSIIAHILDVKLSDADAKAIGRGGHRKRKSSVDNNGITVNKINKMKKNEIVAELAFGGVPYTGNTEQVKNRLLRYRSFLKHIIDGMKSGKLVWKDQLQVHAGRMDRSHEYTYIDGYNRRVVVEKPKYVSYKGITDLKGLREAGKQLHIKGYSKMKTEDLKAKIIDEGLRFGFVDDDEYDDLLEDDSGFNKS